MASEGCTTEQLIEEMRHGPDGAEFSAAYDRASFLIPVASLIWRARRDAGLTQQQLARRLGTTQPAVARWERDTEGHMSLATLYSILAACGVRPRLTIERMDDERSGGDGG